VRVIAGAAKGRRLQSPRGTATRPLTSRVREALFSSLGPVTKGARVLDLYAGSGSMGLEALSRGAESCVFVERARPALAALRANVATIGLGGEVVADDVDRFLERTGGPYDLVFVDPPYALPLASVTAVIAGLVPHLAEGAVVVLHRRAGDDPPEPPAPLRQTDRRRYGDSELSRYVLDGEPKEDK
jgi:16S rRNA (guanine966-N2)-methyltransferase